MHITHRSSLSIQRQRIVGRKKLKVSEKFTSRKLVIRFPVFTVLTKWLVTILKRGYCYEICTIAQASLFLDSHCRGEMLLELAEVARSYNFSGSNNTVFSCTLLLARV